MASPSLHSAAAAGELGQIRCQPAPLPDRLKQTVNVYISYFSKLSLSNNQMDCV